MVSKMGVIGVGGWGKHHARVLKELECLAAVCDIDAARAKETATKHGTHAFSSVNDMLDKEQLDGCLVCTPTKSHASVARKMMERGINTFVENPMSFSAKECEELMQVAEKKQVILTSGYVEHFNPVICDARKLMEDGTYGDPMMIEFHRENRMALDMKDVGVISETSVHDIDAAMFLFGSQPHVVFARASKGLHSFEDFATIMLGFEKQKAAIIASNWLTQKKVRNFSVVCTDATITGDFLTQEMKINQADNTIMPRRQFQEPLTLELRNFVEAIEGKARIVVTATDATNVTRVAEAAIVSSNTGSPVYLDLK